MLWGQGESVRKSEAPRWFFIAFNAVEGYVLEWSLSFEFKVSERVVLQFQILICSSIHEVFLGNW